MVNRIYSFWRGWLSLILIFIVTFFNQGVMAANFDVTGFTIEGDNPLSEQRTQAVLAQYAGKQDGIGRLRKAAQALETRLQKRGYVFHRVSLPPQKLTAGKVLLRVTRLTVGQISTVGNTYFSDDNLKRSLPQLQEGATPNNKTLTRALAIANGNSAKVTQLTFSRGLTFGTMDARIAVQESDPKQLYLWANNTGDKLSTKSRLGIGWQHRNVFDLDHQLSATASISPEDITKVQQYGLNYLIPVYAATGRINILAAKSASDSGRVADVFDVRGSGTTLGLGYTQILNAKGGLRQQVSMSVTDKLFKSDIKFENEPIGQDVRSRPVSLAYQAEWDKKGWSGLLRVAYDENLSGGGLNDAETYEIVRKGAEQGWRKQMLDMRLQYKTSKRWRVDLSVMAQATSDKLIAGEKLGMGGNAVLRGFSEREASFDHGIAGALTLWMPPFKQTQFGAFYDFGRGNTLAPETGEVASDTLGSVGLALKSSWGSRWVFDLSYGRVLNGIQQTEGGELSQSGDNRIHANLLYRIL